MGDRLGIRDVVDNFACVVGKVGQKLAPGEARTHGLQIMRLTRCLLRYGGILLPSMPPGKPVVHGLVRKNICCQKWDLNPRPHTRTRIL